MLRISRNNNHFRALKTHARVEMKTRTLQFFVLEMRCTLLNSQFFAFSICLFFTFFRHAGVLLKLVVMILIEIIVERITAMQPFKFAFRFQVAELFGI